MKNEILAILDKHVDQEAMVKDLALLLIKPSLEAAKAKVESGEIDLIKGTDMDKEIMLKALSALLEKVA